MSATLTLWNKHMTKLISHKEEAIGTLFQPILWVVLFGTGMKGCAGNILGIAAFEMIIDKLLDTATWVKVPTEEPVFGALYARSIEVIDPNLAYTIAVLPFEGGNTEVQEFLFSQSDIVRATGGELARKNLEDLAHKHRIPIAGHWHKFSFITISKEFMDENASDIAELVSLDVSVWDQQGCFSPQEIFVEE